MNEGRPGGRSVTTREREGLRLRREPEHEKRQKQRGAGNKGEIVFHMG